MIDFSVVDTPELITASQLSVYMGGKLSGTDPRVIEAAKGAANAIRNYCGWSITGLTTSFVLDGPGGHLLQLPTLHLKAVNWVFNDGERIEANRYDWSANGTLVARNFTWSTQLRAVTVTAATGFATTPADVTQIALAVAARQLASPAGVVREQVGQVSVTYSTVQGTAGALGLSESEKAILAPYRIVRA